MPCINNYTEIRSLLDPVTPDDFYHLQLIQRKKDNPLLGLNSRVIKSYYIDSMEYFDKIKNEVINICNHNNARACINLNKKSYEKVAHRALVNMSNLMSIKEYRYASKVYNRAVDQTTHQGLYKRWVVDIDVNDEFHANSMWSYIVGLQKNVFENYQPIALLPSKSGFHIISNPFDTTKFREKYPMVDIHKNSPTNLYIP
ncbi:hypothetical protein N9933_01125 [bacterium]|nr:hypothetical protein [bacterium]